MKHLLLAGLMAVSLVGCNGGGSSSGSSSSGTVVINPELTHEEVADLFVTNLNLDPDFEVSLVKTNTLELDYIVIYDPYTDSYDAVNIGGYDPDYDNAADYYFDNSAASFYDLNIQPGHYVTEYEYVLIGYDALGYEIWDYEPVDVWIPTRYADPNSSFVFEKTAATPKDLAKMNALKEVAAMDKKAKFLSKNFGLSLDRGKEIARLAAHWKKASLKGMTDAERDNFSTELLGFSITAGKKAAKDAAAGNLGSLQNLIDNAAAKNGITPEHASKLMTKVFGL